MYLKPIDQTQHTGTGISISIPAKPGTGNGVQTGSQQVSTTQHSGTGIPITVRPGTSKGEQAGLLKAQSSNDRILGLPLSSKGEPAKGKASTFERPKGARNN